MNGELDVVKLIKQQIDYHLGKVEKLKKALVILENNHDPHVHGQVSSTSKKRVKWSSKILDIFRINSEISLSPQDLKTMLINKGYTQLNDPGKKNTVYTIVARLEKKGVIEKIDKGRYRLKTTQQPQNKEEDENQQR